jgi:polar amino acid transport system substrate-binding protein
MKLFLNKLLIVSFVTLLLNPLISKAESIDNIIWMTHNYPPYNYLDDKNIAAGSNVDVVKEILLEVGSKKTLADIQVVAFARGYQDLLSNKDYALISTSRNAERENLFKWVGPLAPSNVVVFAKKSSHIKINLVEDLSNYTISVVNNSIAHQLLIKDVKDLKVEATPSLVEGVKKLEAGRVDLIVGDEEVLKYLVAQQGLDNNNYEPVYLLTKSDYWVAFNKDTSDDIVKSIQAALDRVKKK